MPIRQTRVFVKSLEPEDGWWDTLIGTVFRPVTEEFEDSLEWFWFSRYACDDNLDSNDCDISSIPVEYKQPLQPGGVPYHRSMRFRFCLANQARLEQFERRAGELIGQRGYRVSDFREYDFVRDTGGDRLLGIENRQAGRAERRAVLTTRFYSAISRFVIDALVGPDEKGRFRMESNDDSNNPNGSTFESLLHLFCNITSVPTRLYVHRNAQMNLMSFSTFTSPSLPDGWDLAGVYPLRF